MSRRIAIGLGALCLFVVVAAFLATSTVKEPSYGGKSLGQWLEDIGSLGRQHSGAYQAIQAMGSNAVPFLVHELQVKDSVLKRKLVWLAQKQKFIRFRFVDAETRHDRARAALKTLGPAAKPAIPVLIERFKR